MSYREWVRQRDAWQAKTEAEQISESSWIEETAREAYPRWVSAMLPAKEFDAKVRIAGKPNTGRLTLERVPNFEIVRIPEHFPQTGVLVTEDDGSELADYAKYRRGGI
jgi:hypothetical protein